MPSKKFIYLDHAASTPVAEEAFRAMRPFLRRQFANPSSSHGPGQEARAAVENARRETARLLDCKSESVVFTSGASEANNTVIQGAVPLRAGLRAKQKPHLVISLLEHESIIAPAADLQKRGLADVSWIAPGEDGIVRVGDVLAALKKRTVLVSLAYASGVLGTIQPVKEVGAALKKRGIPFHTDAVQALQFLPCHAADLGADFMTLSAHKVYGPKGVGVLYIRSGNSLPPLILGAKQEGGMRSGTENVPGIAGAGAAFSLLCHHRSSIAAIRMRHLRDRLVRHVLRAVPGSSLAGSNENRLPNNAYFLFEGVEGADLVLLLDRRKIAVSAGSACSDRNEEAPAVLRAIGLPDSVKPGIRVTLGKDTSKEEIERAGRAIADVVAFLRKQQENTRTYAGLQP